MRPTASFADLNDEELRDFSRALKTVLLKYNGRWQRPMPYVMAIHQGPADRARHPEAQRHTDIRRTARNTG